VGTLWDGRDDDTSIEIVLADRLACAVEAGEIRVALQPVFNSSSGSLHGFEALARWHDPILGTISPDEFIPLAERSDIILTLGASMLSKSCRLLVGWNAGHPDHAPLRISVNVSPFQLRHPRLLADIQKAIHESDIDPGLLILELTESAWIDPDSVSMLWRLRGLGVHLAMDDFGTGYSSLSGLTHLPIDIVKIDKTMVSSVVSNSRCAQLLSSVIALVHDLGLDVVAEGVETTEQVERVRAMGADKLQGFRLSLPLEVGQLGDLLEIESEAMQLCNAFPPPIARSRPLPFTVLIVEDDSDSAQLMRYLISSMVGVRVVVAGSVSQFDHVMCTEHPDLVLMDLNLPDGSGLDLARRIGESADVVVPVVAVTAYPERLGLENFGNHGFVGLVSKPISVESFAHQIDSYLPVHRRTQPQCR